MPVPCQGHHRQAAHRVDRPRKLMVADRQAGELEDVLPITSFDFRTRSAAEGDELPCRRCATGRLALRRSGDAVGGTSVPPLSSASASSATLTAYACAQLYPISAS